MILKSVFPYIILILSSSSFAQIYKWTDQEGTVHFSDQAHDNVNEEKINVSSPNSMKGVDPDSVLNSYLNELTHKADEMNNEAKACYYNATERKIMDVSCKNFQTLLDRDFKPLVEKIKDFIRGKPEIKNIEDVKQKLDGLIDIAKEADEHYKQALKYLLYLYENRNR